MAAFQASVPAVLLHPAALGSTVLESLRPYVPPGLDAAVPGHLISQWPLGAGTIDAAWERLAELARSLPGDRWQSAVDQIGPEAAAQFLLLAATPTVFLLALLSFLLLRHRAIRRKDRQRADSESRQRAIFAALGEGVIGTDSSGRCTFVNPAAIKMLGFIEEKEIIGKRPDTLVRFESSEEPCALQDGQPMGQTVRDGRTRRCEGRITRKDGTVLPVEMLVTPLVDRGAIRGAVAAFSDITERKSAEEQLLKLSLAVEQNAEAVVITDRYGRIEYVNDACIRTSGFSREELIGASPNLFSSGKTFPETYDNMWKALHKGQIWRGEFLNRAKNGHEYVELATITPVRDRQGNVSHFLAIKQDISELKHAEAEIHRLARHDALTGLPNRALLIEKLVDAIRAGTGHERRAALLVFNVDRFKMLNHARGETAGDQLLQAIARRIGGVTRAAHVVARLGADEFAILLQTLNPEQGIASRSAYSVAERVQRELRARFEFDEGPIEISVSIGITLIPEDNVRGTGEGSVGADTPEEILRRADAALHKAKRAGGNQIAFFEIGMGEATRQRFHIERELRVGIPAGQLRFFLQPQVEGQSRIVGFEALVRWQHPGRGLLSPSAFIPFAEESDLIVQIGEWVLTRAGELIAKEHNRLNGVRLAVNVSPRQFLQPRFVPWLKETLARVGADPHLLTLEMTEGMMIDNVEETVAKMSVLQALGVRFSMDDFGTGYSSLAYLKRLPINELKIDKSFIQDAPNDPDDGVLVETILNVARHLKLAVVAEGVENEAQAEFLNARMQIIHQGYYYGRPEPADVWVQRLPEPLAHGLL